MDFTFSDNQVIWRDRVRDFMQNFVYSAETKYNAHLQLSGEERWQVPPIIEELKARLDALEATKN